MLDVRNGLATFTLIFDQLDACVTFPDLTLLPSANKSIKRTAQRFFPGVSYMEPVKINYNGTLERE